jgi:hypothetical protein
MTKMIRMGRMTRMTRNSNRRVSERKGEGCGQHLPILSITVDVNNHKTETTVSYYEIIFSPVFSSTNFVSYFPASAFVTSYNLYIVTKFCVGFFTAGNILSIFVLGKLWYCALISHILSFSINLKIDSNEK